MDRRDDYRLLDVALWLRDAPDGTYKIRENTAFQARRLNETSLRPGAKIGYEVEVAIHPYGYQVGRRSAVEELRLLPNRFDLESVGQHYTNSIYEWLNDHREQLIDPSKVYQHEAIGDQEAPFEEPAHLYVGKWTDEEGMTYYDGSEWIEDRGRALEEGKVERQQAIWDWERKVSVPVEQRPASSAMRREPLGEFLASYVADYPESQALMDEYEDLQKKEIFYKLHHDEITVANDAAASLWEAYLYLTDGNESGGAHLMGYSPVLARDMQGMQGKHGMAGLREMMVGFVEPLLSGYDAAVEEGYEASFDWDFCRFFITTCINWRGPKPTLVAGVDDLYRAEGRGELED